MEALHFPEFLRDYNGLYKESTALYHQLAGRFGLSDTAFWLLYSLREADRPACPPYLRVLGANGRGRAVLRALDAPLPVITKPAHGRGIPLLELEARCTDFYALCQDPVQPCGGEWTHSPVIL